MNLFMKGSYLVQVIIMLIIKLCCRMCFVRSEIVFICLEALTIILSFGFS